MESRIEFLKKYISIIIGSLIFAAGLEFFLIPNNILDGGVIGVSILHVTIWDYHLGFSY